MKPLLSKKLGTAFLYAAQTPLAVWAGFAFGAENYPLALLLTGVLMVFEAGAVVLWIDAQTEAVKGANPR